MVKSHGLLSPVEEKEQHGHSLKGRVPQSTVATLSREEHPDFGLTGFYFFSGHITLRMVFIYCAQVHFRWLPFTENKGEDVANYIKKEGYWQMKREKWLN